MCQAGHARLIVSKSFIHKCLWPQAPEPTKIENWQSVVISTTQKYQNDDSFVSEGTVPVPPSGPSGGGSPRIPAKAGTPTARFCPRAVYATRRRNLQLLSCGRAHWSLSARATYLELLRGIPRECATKFRGSGRATRRNSTRRQKCNSLRLNPLRRIFRPTIRSGTLLALQWGRACCK